MGFLDWAGEQIGNAGEAIGNAAEAVGDFAVEIAGDARDYVVTSFGGDSMAQNAAQEQRAAAQQAGQQERQKLAAQTRGLESQNGFDPPSISQHENWRSMSHRHIYDTNQRSLSESDADAIGKAWDGVGEELATIGDELAREVPAATQGGWEGEAADAANRSVKPQADWMRSSGDVFRLTGNRIRQAGSAAGQVKKAVPEPQDHDISQNAVATVLGGPSGMFSDGVQQMQARQEAARHAQDSMQRVYSGTYSEVDRTVPSYKQMDGKDAPPPPVPPPNVPPVPPSVSPGGGGSAGTVSAGTGGSNSGSGGSGPSGYPGGSPSAPGYPGGPGAPGSGAPGGNGPGSQEDPAGSSSAGYSPPAPNAPGAPGTGYPGGGAPGAARPGAPGGGGAVGGGYVAGGGAGGGGGGRSGYGGGRSGSALGSGARSGSGMPGSGSSGSSSSGTTSSSGRGGGRMPMGAMRGGQGQDQGGEEEHEKPSWLVEADDVFTDDMQRTAPPVLGALPWEYGGNG